MRPRGPVPRGTFGLVTHSVERDTAQTMSQENVELAKRFNEAGRRGEAEAAFFRFVAEDVVATDFGVSLDTPNVVHGRNALLDVYRQVAAVFDDYWREVDEYVEVGDWVIAVGRWVGKARPVEFP